MANRSRKTTRSGRRSTRASLHQPRPSIWESIQGANQRAQQRANQRAWRRQGLTSVKAAIADTNTLDVYELPTAQLILRSLLAFLLLVPSAISTLALFTITEHTGDSHFWTNIAQSRPFLFFAVGSFLMTGWFYSRLFSQFFLYLYVLGHELTHVIFICICGGRVSGFNVTLDGGYVMTNKSNVLIALSPYFVPFWSFVVLAISSLLKLFWDIPYHDYALYLAIGATWTFHLAYTIWMIPRDQPDLKENGTFFSIVIIYLANVLLLATMLCLVPGGLNFKSYAVHWVSLFSHFMEFSEVLIQKASLTAQKLKL
ncbi:hypothetical protein ACFPK9_12095 [Rubritalea spongiae]|uniref:Uncharacterized protein n=1 Tax=Rubritalea spongiae TaxID=430797 RepID=A0ABW5E326_9BACT